MKSCEYFIADCGDKGIFYISSKAIRNRMITVYQKIKNRHCILNNDYKKILSPGFQSTLTVSQNPHGSGKTYGLTKCMIDNKEEYDTNITVAKVHSAKDVTTQQLIEHLKKNTFHYEVQNISRKKIIKFKKRIKSIYA